MLLYAAVHPAAAVGLWSAMHPAQLLIAFHAGEINGERRPGVTRGKNRPVKGAPDHVAQAYGVPTRKQENVCLRVAVSYVGGYRPTEYLIVCRRM